MKLSRRQLKFARHLMRCGEIVERNDWTECGEPFTERYIKIGEKYFLVDMKKGIIVGLWFVGTEEDFRKQDAERLEDYLMSVAK